jgi:hypothetical protein
MDLHQVAGDANARKYENVRVYLRNLNVKIPRCYAVTLLDLSMESTVNQGDHPHNISECDNTEVSLPCDTSCNKCCDLV